MTIQLVFVRNGQAFTTSKVIASVQKLPTMQ